MSDWNDPKLASMRDRLLETLRGYGRVAVAYSGGVDSAVVAQAAFLALGEETVAVTAVSDSLASGELEEAEALARQIGIRHRIIRTEEFADPNYLRNNPDRCYFCKSELYGRLSGLVDDLGVDTIVSGANTDDAGDHRPGMKAAAERGVRHPLQECGLSKANVRALAHGLGPADLGQAGDALPVEPDRVWRRGHARARADDRWGRGLAPSAGAAAGARAVSQGGSGPGRSAPGGTSSPGGAEVRTGLVKAFRDLGFKFVTLDLEGFRSGSLNTLVPLELLSTSAVPSGR